MRRCRAVAVLGALVLLAACTPDAPEPAPGPEPQNDNDGGAEEAPATGLRIGIVLPPRDLGSADEVAAGELGLDDLATTYEDEVSELRILVPDAQAFVPDVATLLVADDYDLVCVLGRDAGPLTTELAQRHAATNFCAAPVEPMDQPPDNLFVVEIALEELGHVVGVALGQLGGENPVALFGVGSRAGGESFRSGLRAGVGVTPLRESRGDLEDLQAEIDTALEDEVAAIAVDAGPGAAELVGALEGVALLAPVPLFADGDDGALRWRVRFEVVVEAVLAHLLDPEVELPTVLGVADDVFAVDHGPQAGGGLVEAVEQVMGELERGERDPLEPPDEEEPPEDNDAPGPPTGP